MAILSEGIKLYVTEATWTQDTQTQEWSWVFDDAQRIKGLMEIPSLGGSPDKVDITTLEDHSYHYMAGITDYGDMEYKFLYESGSTANYRTLKTLELSQPTMTEGTSVGIRIVLGDGTQFDYAADISADIDAAGVNAPITFTLTTGLKSDVIVTYPS